MDSNKESEVKQAETKKSADESNRKADGKKTEHSFKKLDGSSEAKGSNNLDFSKSFVQDLLPFSKSKETTGEFLKVVHEMMLEYVYKTYSRKSKILDFHHPHQLIQGIEGFSLELTGKAESLEQILVDCRDTLKYGVKTGHPHFFNQLSSGLDIVSLAAEWITATANTNMFTYEIAPVFVLMEEIVLKRMRQIVGWIDGDGIFSPGGTINNLYAVMLARQQVFPSAKDDGLFHLPELVMFQSKHAHYSNKRPASILGIGSRNCVDVEVDNNGAMIPEDLEKKIIEAQRSGKQPFYVTATSGTTVKGAFDPLREISEICRRFNLWLHVDGAWGAAVLMSRKHRHLMDGVELANSITWNPHKMMGVVLQCSALLIRKRGALEVCNSMRATYLFQQDKHYDVTFDTGDKTIQCGRHVDVFKFWLAWRAKGDEGFEKHVDNCIDLSRYLVEKINKTPGFKLVFENPQFTNVCFWYFPPKLRSVTDKNLQEKKLAKVAPLIKSRMMENGTLMIGYQPLDNTVNFFRNVISNPAVTRGDVDFIIEEIERLGHDLDV